eukprot:TRINITY_DN12282_c0_g1_i1.p1 TRINITY_DN12282_c0_g1~~TRINITY_DN12282_c0_g1_i1.p1  ORF type:complete len:375 (-),score=122.42 TRINITY_DN12282_c0_g1_i1:17-1102(-)
MEPEPALPVVSFVDDKKSKQKIQKILDKRQKKRKADSAAYRVENKAPVGLAAAKSTPKSSKTSETPNKKRKLSEESEPEDNFETMLPDSSDEEDAESQMSEDSSAESDGSEDAPAKKSNEKPIKDTKARLSGALSALLAGADSAGSGQSASAQSGDSDVDEEALDAAPILSEVRKTSAQRRAEKKAAKEAQRIQSELRLQKKLLKNKDHVVLDGLTNEVDKEARLRKIGTKGVVKLFNAIRTAQKLDQIETVSTKTQKKKEKGENMSKEKFLEILQRDRNISADEAQKMLTGEAPAADPVSTKVKSETAQSSSSGGSSWKVLRDDYLLGARMKDWDKEHSDDEVEREVENDEEMEDEDESE